MSIHTALITLAFALASVADAGRGAAASSPAFEVANRYGLGGQARRDELGYDAARRRLFVGRGSDVLVVDADTGKLAGTLPGTNGVHGFAFVQPLKLGFITNDRANSISVVELDSLRSVDTIKAGGAGPDAIRYVPELNRLYIGNGHDASVSALDIVSRKIVATVAVGGKPASLASDGSGRVFVAMADKAEIVAINGVGNNVLAHWPLARCEKLSGLAIDSDTQRLFAACANHVLDVVDARSGEEIASVPIGGRPGMVAFDPLLKLVFVPNGGDGTMSVVHEDAANRYRVVDTVLTQQGTGTIVLDEARHRAYLVSSTVPPDTPARRHSDVASGTDNVMVVRPAH
ncbi:YncE family protein [Burkholderia sp. Ac-20379]|uniref:YncE family protein n=1 Tax=Burkholderia sp. Ac-20379 TaxID=2703900 RepID=UPI00197E2270|nr:YncE family protein [Burkholderia sp. Ac-20379]MBN3723066.1 YncE family protein [Burkholderia sp. Ac-20379]